MWAPTRMQRSDAGFPSDLVQMPGVQPRWCDVGCCRVSLGVILRHQASPSKSLKELTEKAGPSPSPKKRLNCKTKPEDVEVSEALAAPTKRLKHVPVAEVQETQETRAVKLENLKRQNSGDRGT